MRSLKLLATVVLAALVHFAGVRLWPDFARATDVFLVVVALHGLEGELALGAARRPRRGAPPGHPDLGTLRSVRFR